MTALTVNPEDYPDEHRAIYMHAESGRDEPTCINDFRDCRNAMHDTYLQMIQNNAGIANGNSLQMLTHMRMMGFLSLGDRNSEEYRNRAKAVYTELSAIVVGAHSFPVGLYIKPS